MALGMDVQWFENDLGVSSGGSLSGHKWEESVGSPLIFSSDQHLNTVFFLLHVLGVSIVLYGYRDNVSHVCILIFFSSY